LKKFLLPTPVMEYQTITLEPFYLVGISVRTTNEGGQSGKDIGQLWERFFKENILAQIPDKTSNDIYCVYTDYERDASGPYTTLLGCAVSIQQTVPEGFTGKVIPGATYRVYTSVGKLPDSVLATWMHIWQTPIDRSYQADFDVYGITAQDPNNAEVKTYVSVR
jgi:predicted transcriptional regulator YdeE